MQMVWTELGCLELSRIEVTQEAQPTRDNRDSSFPLHLRGLPKEEATLKSVTLDWSISLIWWVFRCLDQLPPPAVLGGFYRSYHALNGSNIELRYLHSRSQCRLLADAACRYLPANVRPARIRATPE